MSRGSYLTLEGAMQRDTLDSLAEMHRLLRSGEAKTLRVAAGLSRRWVGEYVGVSREAVQKWELGDRTPRGDVAVRYAQLLQVLQKVQS